MAADEGGELLGWNRFFSEVTDLLLFCSRRVGTADRQTATYIVERLQVASQNVAAIRDVLRDAELDGLGAQEHVQGYGRRMENIVNAIHGAIGFWERYMETLDRQMERMAYHAPKVYTGLRGRPKFHITGDQLEYLRALSFSWTAIASLLCVSRMTIYRCRRAHNLLVEPSTIPTDTQLRAIIRRIRSESPEFGQNLVHGSVRALGHRVTRGRVREVMRTSDPLNTALRMPGGLTARRKYNVPGPNSLWHVGK
jgi:hypothetical protein